MKKRIKKWVKFKKIKNKVEKVLSKKKRFFINNSDNDSNFSIVEVVFIALISIIFGIFIGYFITSNKININSNNYNSNLSEIVNTYDNIVKNYYDKVDENELSNSAIKGMMESLNDPYTSFMDSNDTKTFKETVTGSFVGIGVVISFEDNYNVIVEVNKGGPAEKAGLQEGDILLKVDNTNVSNASAEDLSKMVRGDVGSEIKITVKRNNERKSFKIKRDVIEIQNVTSDVIDSDQDLVGYIKIDSFASNSYKQFNKELKKLEKKNVKSLVIDVRDNYGGNLYQTREILSLFFDKKTVLYQLQSKKGKSNVYSLSNTKRSYPVVVLINDSSVSASEILASCFKEEYKNAFVVGNTSYGKGTIQKSYTLNDGSSIKYTNQKWLTSKGEWLNGIGVEPDIIIDQSNDYYENSCFDTDVQLQTALKKLKESD